MAERKKRRNEKKKESGGYLDPHDGYYYTEEFLKKLERSAKQKPIVIDDLDAWFKERYGV